MFRCIIVFIGSLIFSCFFIFILINIFLNLTGLPIVESAILVIGSFVTSVVVTCSYLILSSIKTKYNNIN